MKKIIEAFEKDGYSVNVAEKDPDDTSGELTFSVQKGERHYNITLYGSTCVSIDQVVQRRSGPYCKSLSHLPADFPALQGCEVIHCELFG